MVWLWIGFVVFVLGMLALDLGVLNRRAHVIRTREALLWSAFCALLALLFNVFVYFAYEHQWLGINTGNGPPLAGADAARQFFMGWLVEQSLSLDNIFVIAVIFAYFNVPLTYQHRTLFWGIIGALVMRGAMIGAGVALVERFAWVNYILGALLLLTAVKMLRAGDQPVYPERNPLVRLARRFYPVSSEFDGQKFLTRVDGRRAITPLLLVLLVIESTDVLFAVDSIPAILVITGDPFIVFTSNVFAILNLRSLYFALADLIEKFRYLKFSLVFILAYVGVKSLLKHHYEIPDAVSLAIIAGTFGVGVLASIFIEPRRSASAPGRAAPPEEG